MSGNSPARIAAQDVQKEIVLPEAAPPAARTSVPYLIPPIPALAELRTEVLSRSEKRTPKLGVRLADDLIMEIQAKPVFLISPQVAARGIRQQISRFEGSAVMAVGADEPMLKKMPRGVIFWSRKFSLVEFADDPGRWQLSFHSGRKSIHSHRQGWLDLNKRVLAALQPDGVFAQMTPALMLRPTCLICGRALTDAASRARMVGPECAGTSSLRIFWASEEGPSPSASARREGVREPGKEPS